MNINKKFIVCDIKVLRTFFVAKAYLAILNCVIALRHVFHLSMAFVIRNYAITMRVLFLISEIEYRFSAIPDVPQYLNEEN